MLAFIRDGHLSNLVLVLPTFSTMGGRYLDLDDFAQQSSSAHGFYADMCFALDSSDEEHQYLAQPPYVPSPPSISVGFDSVDSSGVEPGNHFPWIESACGGHSSVAGAYRAIWAPAESNPEEEGAGEASGNIIPYL